MLGRSAFFALRRAALWALALVVGALQGCATVAAPDRHDPLESMNRNIFAFNEALDSTVVKPVATAYRDATPDWMRKGASNFFNNVEDLWSAVNNVLQLRGRDAGDSFTRVLVNSTMGLMGVLDVASEMRIERHSANLGLTLGRWGVGSGPYLVLPFIGPSTLRDGVALPLDMQASGLNAVRDVPTRDGLKLVDVVNTRARYLDAGDVVEGAALDKYSFLRDAYLQRRRNLVYDGDPPNEPEDTQASPP